MQFNEKYLQLKMGLNIHWSNPSSLSFSHQYSLVAMSFRSQPTCVVIMLLSHSWWRKLKFPTTCILWLWNEMLPPSVVQHGMALGHQLRKNCRCKSGGGFLFLFGWCYDTLCGLESVSKTTKNTLPGLCTTMQPPLAGFSCRWTVRIEGFW